MPSESRVVSILNATCLSDSFTGYKTFEPSQLSFDTIPAHNSPTNLRLGHLVEKSFAALLKGSKNYAVEHENLQVVINGSTIGELDFILRERTTGQLIHLEVTYKFYLLDPTLPAELLQNWIGPNRNDSLGQKLQKLQSKQFPLLHHAEVKNKLGLASGAHCEQQLCFMAQLFIPLKMKSDLPQELIPAIKGWYMNMDQFDEMDHSASLYHLPLRTEWGIHPESSKTWMPFEEMKDELGVRMDERQSQLVWHKEGTKYSTFFVTWW